MGKKRTTAFTVLAVVFFAAALITPFLAWMGTIPSAIDFLYGKQNPTWFFTRFFIWACNGLLWTLGCLLVVYVCLLAQEAINRRAESHSAGQAH